MGHEIGLKSAGSVMDSGAGTASIMMVIANTSGSGTPESSQRIYIIHYRRR